MTANSTCLQFTAFTQVPTIHSHAPAARTSTILLTRVQSTHEREVVPSLRARCGEAPRAAADLNALATAILSAVTLVHTWLSSIHGE